MVSGVIGHSRDVVQQGQGPGSHPKRRLMTYFQGVGKGAGADRESCHGSVFHDDSITGAFHGY